jgi:hypothetical protein
MPAWIGFGHMACRFLAMPCGRYFKEPPMYQNPLNLASTKSFDPVVLTEVALRSAEQFYAMNVSATGVLLQTQASAATALGLPDWSSMIAATTEQTHQVLAASTDQLLQAAQQASEVMQAFQLSASDLVEEQSAKTAEAWQAGVSDLETLHKPDLPLSPLSDAVQNALPHGE